MIPSKAGFTLMEVIIAMALVGIIFSMTAYYFNANKSDTGVGSRVFGQFVVTTIKSQYFHSITGYSARSSDEGVRDNVNVIPTTYGITFEKGGYYRILELQNRLSNGNTFTRVLWKDDKDFYDPSVILANITLKNAPEDITGINVDDITFTFQPPFGALDYYTNNRNFLGNGAILMPDDSGRTMHEFPKQTPDNRSDYVELLFQDTNGNTVATVFVGKGKQFFLK